MSRAASSALTCGKKTEAPTAWASRTTRYFMPYVPAAGLLGVLDVTPGMSSRLDRPGLPSLGLDLAGVVRDGDVRWKFRVSSAMAQVQRDSLISRAAPPHVAQLEVSISRSRGSLVAACRRTSPFAGDDQGVTVDAAQDGLARIVGTGPLDCKARPQQPC